MSPDTSGTNANANAAAAAAAAAAASTASASGSASASSDAATFCATLVDEWISCGVRHAVVAPGSRSTPLALALAARSELSIHVFHDERSAAFAALGMGRAGSMPAILLCTSGTAAANFHPAVIEAHQDEVSIVVCTADRPPELRDVAAPQTIDQTKLYGNAVRWFHDPGVAGDDGGAPRSTWRQIASRAVSMTLAPWRGPVHLNLPFREPLVGTAGELPSRRGERASLVAAGVPDAAMLDTLAERLERQRGVIVAGASGVDGATVLALAECAGWPVLADPRSAARRDHPNVVVTFDDLLRHERFARDHVPEVVLRIGFPPASRLLAEWLAASGATQVQVHDSAAWIDPRHDVTVRVQADPDQICAGLVARLRGGSGTTWATRWRHAEANAQQAIDTLLTARAVMSEPAIARATVAALPAGARLMVSSSMPVRDVEWYARPRSGVEIHANRGANGIDGVTSTAVGLALVDPLRPTALLIGDIAFLHDTNALLALARRSVNLTIVVVDNDGGAIFSFLPQRNALTAERFEQLFGTPHGTDPGAVAAAHGLHVERIGSIDELRRAIVSASAEPGVTVLHVRTDRDDNIAAHADLHRAVAAALDHR